MRRFFLCLHIFNRLPYYSLMRRKHTKESLKGIAQKFVSRVALKRGDFSAYLAMLKLGIIDECCAHMAPLHRSYTDQSLREIAANFQSRISLKKSDINAYTTMVRRGILDECCAHMKPAKRGHAPYVTDEAVTEAFLRYKTLGDIKRGPDGRFYSLARKRYGRGSPRWIELTAHMEPPAPLNECPRLVYLIVFEDGAGYVGITGNLDRRFNGPVGHFKHGVVFDYFEAHPGIKYAVTVLEDGIPPDTALIKKREAFWQKEWATKLTKPLWTKGREGMLGCFSKTTKETARATALSCETKNEFWENHQAVAKIAKKRGWYDEITAHMPDQAPRSEETKSKQSLSAKRRIERNGVSEEWRLKMSELNRKRHAANRLKEAAALGFNVTGQDDTTPEQQKVIKRLKRRLSK